MNLFDRHRKFRNRLSAYVDGELSSDAVRSLDAHMESCDACRLELDEMRATVDALKSIPQVEAPRSFRLTPEMVADQRSAPSWSPSPGLMNGMRMATAGLTMALAVVFFVDLGGSGQDSRIADSLNQAAPAGLTADGGGEPALAEGNGDLEVPVAGGDGRAEVEDAGEPDAAGEQGDELYDTPPELVAPEDDDMNLSGTASGLDKTSGDAQAELGAAGGDSFNELLAAEIGLGLALALAVAGTAGMTFARSRSRQD